MLLHNPPLVRVKRPRLEQDVVWNGDLADVMHGASSAECSLAVRVDPPAEIEPGLRPAGTAHDIGKVAVPDHILLKPGPLGAVLVGFLQVGLTAQPTPLSISRGGRSALP